MEASLYQPAYQGPETRRSAPVALGPRIAIRPIMAGDRDAMRTALGRLSPESCRRRFMAAKVAFTEREIEWLTDVDGFEHVALCATLEGADGSSEIIGTARYHRLGGLEGGAEPSVMIVDDYQGRGVGRVLFERLLATAAEHGIRWFECELLTTNVPMRRLLDVVSHGAAQYEQAEPGSVIARIPVAPFPRRAIESHAST